MAKLTNKIVATPHTDGKSVKVNAKFYDEEGKVVHEINHAFPAEASAQEIREEVKRSGDLFQAEEAMKRKQVLVDRLNEKRQKVIKDLNDK